MNKRSALVKLFDVNAYPKNAFDIDKTFSGKDIILYGAGEGSIWFFEIVRDMFGYHPSLILDRKFSQQQQFEGVKATSPENYSPSDKEKLNAVVVVCVGSEKIQSEIVNTLSAMGFINIIQLRDIYQIHNPFSQPVELFEQGFSFYKAKQKDIMSAFDLLQDEESQSVFLQFVQTHMQRVPVRIDDRPRDEQYFPSEIDFAKGYQRFVSCGAYDGDTIRLLNDTIGKVEEIICVEAEPAIFARLAKFLHDNSGDLAEKIIALPCAAYDDEQVLNFTTSTGLGSRIASCGDTTTQGVALDHVLPDFRPSFISMDIEGAEPDALKGAENMIREHKPDLGICVYHSPNHIWQILLYLHNLNLGYKFYLRNYTSFTIETVLYATVEMT